MHNIGSLPLLGFVSACVSCGTAFAQVPAAADRWPDSWNDGDPERRYTTIAVEMDRRYDRSWTINAQPRVSRIVTLHELKHYVPGRAEREFQRALAAEGKGDHERAIVYFQKAIAIDPDFCAAFNDFGTTYLQTDQLDLAIEQFNKAIAVDPYGATPYSNLALAYLIKEQYDDAERAARRALEVDRTSTHADLTLGMSLVLQAKLTAEMERSLEKAALDYPCANFWLGIGLLTKGEIDNAKARLKAYLARGEKVGRETTRSLIQQLELMAQSSQ